MAFNFYHSISTDEIAREMSNDPVDTLHILTELANIFDDAGDADDFADQVAARFDSRTAEKLVPPFLRLIADRLDACMEVA
jgi:hypothetical protein